ncbi:MAG TPA: NAD(P)/FAD-dependent oxidoreductase, partial [Clostridia bacterium]|nr:NAD(P)/FAD-dependent oxidoreductase [Clostridia bacterium]
MTKKVLILGAGYAGIEAALTLQKKGKRDDIEIVIIDKNPYHTLLTELHEVAGNRISEDGIIIPLKEIFKYTKVSIIQDEIAAVDLDTNLITSNKNEYKYDYLVIATGSRPNFFGISGMEENCFPLWSYHDAIKIREHIKQCFFMASKESDPELRKSLLTFVVGGGGFTGVEMIGELAQWVKLLCKEYSISKREVKLMLVEALPKILSVLKQKNINKATKYLTSKLNVEVLVDHAITKVTKDSIELKNSIVIPTNTLIWAAGIKAAKIADHFLLGKDKTSRIEVDEFTKTSYSNVYAVGDASAFHADEVTLPALVETALQTSKAAALNILNDIRGVDKKKLKPELHGVMVSIGSFYAVAEIMKLSLPRFLSILMKYLINIHYLFGIGGFEQVAKYLKHELFYKQQEKFLIEKHYSVPTRAFWLVPIRLFLGYSWLMEGIGKINQGWLTKPLLAGLPNADAGSSASVSATGENVFRIISAHTPEWYAWIAQNLVI